MSENCFKDNERVCLVLSLGSCRWRLEEEVEGGGGGGGGEGERCVLYK
jgi:hypothetical protein